MEAEDSTLGGFRDPILLAFLVWVTRQHDDALVTMCGLKLLGSKMKVGNLIEIFQHSNQERSAAQLHVDGIEPGSAEESEMIRTGFRVLTGFEEETVVEIRKQLQI